jgi:hypothetical protein
MFIPFFRQLSMTNIAIPLLSQPFFVDETGKAFDLVRKSQQLLGSEIEVQPTDLLLCQLRKAHDNVVCQLFADCGHCVEWLV